MNTVLKTSVLLIILTVSFFLTAVTVRLTFDQNEILIKQATLLETNLQKKEQIIHQFVSDSTNMAKLWSIDHQQRAHAEELIVYLTDQNNILVYTFEDDNLRFWSSERFIPNVPKGLTQSFQVVHINNGWYHSVIHKDYNYTAVFYIPIKNDYARTNEFLVNLFSPDIIKSNYLEIANYDDRNVYNVRNSDGQFLFSVKLNPILQQQFYSKFEFTLWVLGFIFLLILATIYCRTLSNNGYPWWSILLFGLFLFGLRWLELYYNWFAQNFQVDVFNPRYYASSNFFPNFGAFIINVLLFTWFLVFIYLTRKNLYLPTSKYPYVQATLYLMTITVCFYLSADFLSDVFKSLVKNSSINFDVTDMLNLDLYSWIGIFALCLGMLGLLFFIITTAYLSKDLTLPKKKYFVLQINFAVVLFGFLFFMGQLSIHFVLYAALVFLIFWFVRSGMRFTLAIGLWVLLLVATIVSQHQTEFQRQKREDAQKLAILKLEDVDDANALSLFLDMEQELIKDPSVLHYFKFYEKEAKESLTEYLKTIYFSGYLSSYDFSIDMFDNQMQPIGSSIGSNLEVYRDKVISGAIKVSENFYRTTSGIGNYQYFALFPFMNDGDLEGILLITLEYRSFSQYLSYPGVLGDHKINQSQSDLISGYSFAYYRGGALINQYGNYIYPVVDSMYSPLGIREFKKFGSDQGFSHIAYKPNQRTTIVLSKPQYGLWIQFVSLSFFFLIFLFFFVFVSQLLWITSELNKSNFNIRNFLWNFSIWSNNTLYSTRIQMFIVAAVIFTLIISGIITFTSLSTQYSKQQEEAISKSAWEIAKGLESQIIKQGVDISQEDKERFRSIAESNALDLNLYNTDGRLIFTTQPRIYDLKLKSEYIHPRALDHLGYYSRSQYIQKEQIGNLKYITAYSSINDESYEPIAFVSIPNYRSTIDFGKSMGSLLNTLINIYALVILVLGVFTVIVANRVTAPLQLVQRSLARTKIGKQNEPIFWRRNDEIGSLIREYNLMIAELEQSAQKIMESERESAWREMAQQIAHEIKNPLTPLKLGIQQLERSWNDQDPEFDQRFKRFKESFVEQIDSLSHIAKEFSDFAKMPDTRIQSLDLIEVIKHAVNVFDSYGNVQITFQMNFDETQHVLVEGDKDQLLRMFNNLLKNSIEAVPKKRKCLIEISISILEKHAFIEVKDNGDGISYEMRKKLFQPNFTTKSSGTGLGLAFVKRVVEGMNGQITYQTTLGMGTSFFIRIPITE